MLIELERPQRWLQPPWGMSQDWSLTMSDSKTCTKCKQTLFLTSFSPKPSGKKGLRAECKPCRAAYTRNWAAKNPEKKIAADSEYRAKNKEHIKKTQRQYQQKNKELLAIKSQLWAEKNRDKTRATKKAWDIKNPDSRRQKLLRYRARKANNQIFFITKKEMKKLYSSKCFFCQNTEGIEADHIIPTARGGRHSIGNLMPLCRKCNASKSNKFIMEFKLWQERKNKIAQNNSMD